MSRAPSSDQSDQSDRADDTPGDQAEEYEGAAVSTPAKRRWGVITTYLIERFAFAVRASGYGIGYSLAVVIPGLYAFSMLGLSSSMPYVYTPIVLLVIGGVLIVAGALRGPETRDVDFT